MTHISFLVRYVLGDTMARRRRQIPVSDLPEVVRVRLSSPVVLDDRRSFHPAGPMRPASSFRRADRRIVLKQSSKFAPLRNDTYADWRIGFSVPKRVAICVRRKQRKEIIHALKLSGKGARARRHKRNYWSGVDC